MDNNDQISPIRMCKNNGISRLGSTFSPRRGVGGEDQKMAKSPRNSSLLWSKVTVMDRIEVQIARVSARLSSFSSGSSAKVVKSDHISFPQRLRNRVFRLAGRADVEPLREDRRRGLRGDAFATRPADDAGSIDEQRRVGVVVVWRAVRGAGAERRGG